MRSTNTADRPLKPLRLALMIGLFLPGACAIATEEPAFTLSLAEGPFQVRDYPALIAAEAVVTGDRRAAGSEGFRLLAGYIFGGNTRRQSIAMTAPVLQAGAGGETIAMTAPVWQSGGDGQWLIRFIMPRGSLLEAMPRPNNPRVRLRAMAPARMAVVRFSGVARADKVAANSIALAAFVNAHRFLPIGPVSLAQYDPPWTLWFLRRNELMIPIAPVAAG